MGSDPVLLAQIARANIMVGDPGAAKRMWQFVMDEIVKLRVGPTRARFRFSDDVAAILRTLPTEGQLFPYLRSVRAGDRATKFNQRCVGLGIKGVTLNSYRYSWAERAKQAGYPERFAQEALGHNSKAVHRAYARKAKVIIPTLESFEPTQSEPIGTALPS